MRNQPVPLVTGFYADQDRPFSQQDVWNYLPCRAEKEGARSPLMLKTPPGLFPWLELEGAPPVRGLHDCEGRLFAVIGTTLYRINPKGVAVPIGTIPGNGRVSMDHNQRANGQQLTVVNGSAGYVYDTYADTFERITDTGFPGSPVIRFMDGYMLGLDPAGRFAFSSAAANALDYNTLDRWTSEYRPDRLVGMGRLGGELLLLSANSGEFFGNTGAAQQPFRSRRIFLDKGCAGPHTVVEADNNVFWLGSDGYFYQLDGYNSRRISTRPIEQAIRGLDWWNAFGFVWESEGHTVVYWTFLNGQTWGWDTSQQEWHRRESYGLARWRPSCTARSGSAWYAGDFQKGRIWRLDWGYPWEGDTEFVSGFTLPVIHDNQNELVHSRLELVMDVGQLGVGPKEPQPQPTGPAMSGSAPDGVVGQPYSFTYTLTPGAAPISRVIITAGELVDGLNWDETTATISGTPTKQGGMALEFRVIDRNELYSTHEDAFGVFAAWAYAVAVGQYASNPNGRGLIYRDDDGWHLSPVEPPASAWVTVGNSGAILMTRSSGTWHRAESAISAWADVPAGPCGDYAGEYAGSWTAGSVSTLYRAWISSDDAESFEPVAGSSLNGPASSIQGETIIQTAAGIWTSSAGGAFSLTSVPGYFSGSSCVHNDGDSFLVGCRINNYPSVLVGSGGAYQAKTLPGGAFSQGTAAVVCGNPYWIAFAGNEIFYSSNRGETWKKSAQTFGASAWPPRLFTYKSQNFLIHNKTIYVSTDPEVWTPDEYPVGFLAERGDSGKIMVAGDD